MVGGYGYMQFIAPGPHHDDGDHQLLRQRGVLVLRREVRQASRGAAGLAASELADPVGLHRRAACCAACWSGSVVTVVALFFTRLAVQHVLAVLSAVLLTSVVFSLGGFLNALFAKNFDQISWFPTFVLQPLTYLGGVFYSVTMLPSWAQAVSHVNPILYMVSAFRYGFLGRVRCRPAARLWDHDRRRGGHVRARRDAVEQGCRHPGMRPRGMTAQGRRVPHRHRCRVSCAPAVEIILKEIE